MDLLGNIEANQDKISHLRPTNGYNEVFHDLFDLFVGAGRKYSIKEIARATGISADTISNWSQGISAPQFDNLIILCRVLPFEFKSRFINLLGGADIVSEIRKDYAELFEGIAEQIKQGKI